MEPIAAGIIGLAVGALLSWLVMEEKVKAERRARQAASSQGSEPAAAEYSALLRAVRALNEALRAAWYVLDALQRNVRGAFDTAIATARYRAVLEASGGLLQAVQEHRTAPFSGSGATALVALADRLESAQKELDSKPLREALRAIVEMARRAQELEQDSDRANAELRRLRAQAAEDRSGASLRHPALERLQRFCDEVGITLDQLCFAIENNRYVVVDAARSSSAAEEAPEGATPAPSDDGLTAEQRAAETVEPSADDEPVLDLTRLSIGDAIEEEEELSIALPESAQESSVVPDTAPALLDPLAAAPLDDEHVSAYVASLGEANGIILDTIKLALTVPKSVIERVREAQGDGQRIEKIVLSQRRDLDRALYHRVEAAEIGRELGLEANRAQALADWLRGKQAAAVLELQRLGLWRIDVSVGMPFDHGRIHDSDEEPVPTSNQQDDGRVAGVTPGMGGYEYAGQVICPTRARRYEWVGPNESRTPGP